MKLAEYLNKEIDNNKKKIHIWTSLLKRTVQTVQHVDTSKEHWKALNEIDAVLIFVLIATVYPGVILLIVNSFQLYMLQKL